MRLVRIHADGEGTSHLEEMTIALSPDNLGRISATVAPGTGAFLRELRAGLLVGFHRAPRRQLLFVIRGKVEVECGDGTRAAIGAGEAIFVEDTAGHGHVTRVGEDNATCVYIPVAADFDLRKLCG